MPAVLSLLLVNQVAHSGEKPYICADCGHGFDQNATLIRPRRTYTGESLTGALCVGGLSAGRAQRTPETHRERSLCVPGVWAGLGQKVTLRGHQRTHLGEGPDGDGVCEQRPSQKPDLTCDQGPLGREAI